MPTDAPSPPPDDFPADTARFERGVPPAAGPLADLPGFVLDGEVGRGGSGVVFRAWQETFARTVAVKVLRRTDLDEPRELARFITEAEAAAAVAHPNVVAVHEYGEHAGRPFLVLEFCPGGTLAGRLRRDGRLAPADAARLLAEVADGVHAVHLAGIVHRDLKPGNVLFDGAGRPKVGDFGLAKRAGSVSDLTQSRAVLGTPAYMSPEQARGGTKFVGPGADVWALGVVLYECLAGAVPFSGSDPLAVLREVTDGDPPPLRKLAPDAPPDLCLVAHRCLAKEAADRYPTAAALADDLRAVVAGRPVQARDTGAARRARRWAGRHPAEAALAAGLAASLLAGAVASSALAVRAREREHAAERALALVQAERQATWEALNALTDQTVERLLARQPAVTAADRKFLEGVLAQFDRAAARLDPGADARRLAGHGRFRMARLRQRLGEVGPAEELYRAGLAEFRAAQELDPGDSSAAAGAGDCLEQLGWLLAGVGRAAEGEAAAREAVRVWQALRDPVREGKGQNTLGLVLVQAGRPAEAVAAYRRALALLGPAAADHPRELALTRVNLAGVLERDPATVDEAEQVYEEATDAYRQLLAGDPESPRDRLAAARARLNAGRLHAARGDVAEAVGDYAAGVDLLRGLVREYPAYPDHQHELGRGLTLWAAAEPDPPAAARRLGEAAGHHRKAVQAKPDGVHYRAAFAENRRQAAERAVRLGDHAAAAAAADQWAGLVQRANNPSAADLFARLARLVRWDVRLSPTDRAALAIRYAARAAELLGS